MIDRLKFKSKDPNTSIELDYVDDISTKSVNGGEDINGIGVIEEEQSIHDRTEREKTKLEKVESNKQNEI